jgi:hypothetical protein
MSRSGKSKREEGTTLDPHHSHRATTQSLPEGIRNFVLSAFIVLNAAYTFKIKHSQDITHVNRTFSYETECIQVSAKRGKCLSLQGDDGVR